MSKKLKNIMEESTNREKILKKVRNAVVHKTDSPFPNIDLTSSIYPEINDSLDVKFAEEFSKVSGKFLFCENEQLFIKNLKLLLQTSEWGIPFCNDKNLYQYLDKAGVSYTNDESDFKNMQCGITTCEFLVSRLGSIMVSSRQSCGRRMLVFPPVHIVVAYTAQLVPDIKDALEAMKNKYGNKLPSLISLITGPSRTADIEKTLVMGAHGPKEIYVFLIDYTI